MRAVKEVSSLYITGAADDGPRDDSSAFSAVTAVLEGTRPVLCEVQALVCRPDAASAEPAGAGGRFVSREYYGIDPRRAKMLLAIVSSSVRIDVSSWDVFVNITGGLRIRDPAADLGIACSIVASRLRRRIRAGTLVLGELGLGGELRPVQQMDRRLAEAARYGFARAIVPAHPGAGDRGPAPAVDSSLQVVRVRTLREAVLRALESKEEAARRAAPAPLAD